MDWKILGSVYLMIFLAELGDKTQLATFCAASACDSRWGVFLGSALALITTSAIATLLGAGIAQAVPPYVINKMAGFAFLGFGVYYLVK